MEYWQNRANHHRCWHCGWLQDCRRNCFLADRPVARRKSIPRKLLVARIVMRGSDPRITLTLDSRVDATDGASYEC